MASRTRGFKPTQPIVDLLIAAAGFLVLFFLAGAIDLAEAWHEFAADHEDWELDEIPFAITFLTVSFGWFAWRRWHDFKAESAQRHRLNLRLQRELRLREEIQDGLIKARHEAQAADRAKSEFLANMSHELRTPLNASIGFAELIEQEVQGPIGSAIYKEYIKDIRESGQHLLGLINDILDLSKIEAGKMDLHERSFDPGEVVDNAARMVLPIAGKLDVAVKTELPEPLPTLRADPRLIKQILTNLLSNAVKFSETGSEVTLAMTGEAGKGCVFSVTDRGVGMSEEDVALALQPFGQVDSAFARTRGGTGLGLPLVKALVALHGGELSIESAPGAGTEVSVTLPAERVLWSAPVDRETAA